MPQQDEFDSAGAYVAMKDLEGELVLFTPTEYVEEVQTSFGEKDAVIADLVVLTDKRGPAEYTDQTIFQGALIGSLKRKIGRNGQPSKKLLGRIEKGEAKRGQNAPYILTEPSEDDKQMARDFLAGRTVAAAQPEPVNTVKPSDPFAV